MSGLDAIKQATWTLHTQAERSGIVARILAGTVSQAAVALFFRGLLPVYQVLDATPFCRPELARAESLTADLRLLSPEGLPPLLPAAAAYAETLRAPLSPARMLAHAYVRYLGDLNGGRIMPLRLRISLGDVVDRLAFHAFPGIADMAGYTAAYRHSLDLALDGLAADEVAHEAQEAFRLNIALSEAAIA